MTQEGLDASDCVVAGACIYNKNLGRLPALDREIGKQRLDRERFVAHWDHDRDVCQARLVLCQRGTPRISCRGYTMRPPTG